MSEELEEVVETQDDQLTFRIGEAAKILGLSVSWLRWRESDPEIFQTKEGEPIEVFRTEGNYRAYTIQNLKDMNEAFLRKRKITRAQYKKAKMRIEAFVE